jgi:hypothetical protein
VLVGRGAFAQCSTAAPLNEALIVTAANTPQSQLTACHATGTLLRRMPMPGQGGVRGNAGGIARLRNRLALAHFGLGTVSAFGYGAEAAQLPFEAVVPAPRNPVSVAFNPERLCNPWSTRVEPYPHLGRGEPLHADGQAALGKAHASAAQVGHIDAGLIIAEKSITVET